MGGTSSSQQSFSQTQKTDPYGATKPLLDSLIGRLGGIDTNLTGTETNALNSLTANAQAGNPFAPQISGVASNLLGGGPDRTGMVTGALSEYRNSLLPFASGANANSPELQALISNMTGDITRRVGAGYSAAGRDPSGAGSYAQNVGKGVAQGVAPVLYDAYNQAQNRQLGAINSLYGAGTGAAGLLSGLDQTALGNQQAGITAAQSAQSAADAPFTRLLQLEAQRRGIPMEAIGGILGPLAGVGAQFGTTNTSGQQSGMQTKSLADTIQSWTKAFQNLFVPQQPGGQPFSY